MKRFYTQLIPRLSIMDTKVHDFKTKDRLKYEKKQKALEDRIVELESKDKALNELVELIEKVGKESFIELLEDLKK